MKTINVTVVVDRATLRIIFVQPGSKPNAGIPHFPNIYSVYTGDVSVADAAELTDLNCIQFKFDSETHTATEVEPDSDTIMAQMALSNRKFMVHTVLADKIVAARRSVHKPIYGQVDIYKMKEAQARNFRKAGYVNPAQYPMVQQYAELIGKPPKHAADAILRKARAANAVLASTEFARILYKRSIFAATGFDQLGQVADNIGTLTF